MLCGLGCSAAGSYDLTVKVLVADEAYRPQHLLWSWSSPSKVIFENKRVPSAGDLPQTGSEVAKLLVSVGDNPGDERRIVVRGMRGAQQVSGAAQRVRLDGGRRDVVLTLGPVVDSDGDGVPDEVDDDCPAPGCSRGVKDAAVGSPRSDAAAEPADAARPNTATPDAAWIDAWAPGNRADAGIGGDVITGGDALAAGDGKGANGVACASGVQCASGFCVDSVCCDSTCVGICRACNVSGMVGRCAMVRAGDDPKAECFSENPSTCGRDGTCDGQGGCRKYVAGTQCVAATGCVGGTETLARTCDGKGVCQPPTTRSCVPKLATLVDNFNGTSLDGSKWKPYADPGYTVSQTSQQLRIVNTTSVSGSGGVDSVNRYDGTGSEIKAQFLDPGNASNQFDAWTWIKLLANGSAANAVEISVGGGLLRAKKWVAGVVTERNKPYDAGTMKWLRLRQTGPTLFWEYSSDGVTWISSPLHSEPTPIDMSSLLVEIGAGAWPGIVGTVVVDNVNSPP